MLIFFVLKCLRRCPFGTVVIRSAMIVIFCLLGNSHVSSLREGPDRTLHLSITYLTNTKFVAFTGKTIAIGKVTDLPKKKDPATRAPAVVA